MVKTPILDIFGTLALQHCLNSSMYSKISEIIGILSLHDMYAN